MKVVCPHCGEKLEVTVTKTEVIPCPTCSGSMTVTAKMANMNRIYTGIAVGIGILCIIFYHGCPIYYKNKVKDDLKHQQK